MNKKLEYYWIELEDNQIPMLVDSSGEFLHQNFKGTIYGSPGSTEQKTKVGKIDFLKIDWGRAHAINLDMWEVMDSIDSDTEACGSILIDPETNDIKDHINGKDIMPPDILILIKHLQIKPEYRGQNLGLLAIHSVMQRYCGIQTSFVLQALPLQFVERPESSRETKELEGFTTNKARAKAQLGAHYKKMGFWQIGDTDFYYLPGEYVHPLPKELEQYKR